MVNILLIIRHAMPAFYVCFSGCHPAFIVHSALILSAFLLSVSFYEPLLISLLACRLDVPFSVRAPLHDLLAFVQPEVVSVLP